MRTNKYLTIFVPRDNVNRARLLGKWQRCGGVMLIGYTAFRNLSIGKTVKDKIVRDNLCTSLQVIFIAVLLHSYLEFFQYP